MALLAFGVAGLVAIKAIAAIGSGRRYRFTFLDGGIVFQVKETSPVLMLVLASVYALGVRALPRAAARALPLAR